MIRNVAVTGGAGSGKSTLIKLMKDQWLNFVFFYSMDQFMDELYHDDDWLNWLKKTFGTNDRQQISQRSFSNRAVMNKLVERSSFPIGVRLGRALMETSRSLQVFEVPLLFESGIQNEFDLVVLVTADDDVRVKRIVERGHKTEEQAWELVHCQMPEQQKLAMSDRIIDTTDGDIQRCRKEMHEIIKRSICPFPEEKQ